VLLTSTIADRALATLALEIRYPIAYLDAVRFRCNAIWDKNGIESVQQGVPRYIELQAVKIKQLIEALVVALPEPSSLSPVVARSTFDLEYA
jgi:hypothetical protein